MLFEQPPSGLAPERFVEWLRRHQHTDRRFGHTYQYHPRSDAHSRALAEFVWEDLIARCPEIQRDSASGRVRSRINYRHYWAGTGKTKTIDIAVGPPGDGQGLADVWISCELKSVMTEHKKSEPRIFDELQSSYRIVNSGSPSAIAAGLTVVNISKIFVSPLRQILGQALAETKHNQPRVTESMLMILRGLPRRHRVSETGFDAYCTFVVDADNRGSASLWAGPPAPQPGDVDHYETFLTRICETYVQRFPRP